MELKIITAIFSILFFAITLNDLKKKKLNPKYAVIWIALAIILFIVSIFLYKLRIVAYFLGIKTISNMLFFMGFVFSLFIILHITKTISSQDEKIVILTQELALLKKEIKDENIEE